MKMTVIPAKHAIRACVWLLLTAPFAGCDRTDKSEEPTEEITVSAEVISLVVENATVEKSYPASLEGKVNVEIRPQISGYIEKIYVDEGAFVRAGQPLFQINASVYREQKNTALASLEVARAALASAKLELEKYEILSDKKVVADFQYQKAKASYESAEAAVSQQSALVASSDVNLGFTLVKAPVSGYIGRIPKRLGALVGPSDTEGLTSLSQVDVVYAYFSLPETEILQIYATREGATLLDKLQTFRDIDFLLADGNVYPHAGKIDMMDGQFDKGTGSVTLRASFPNPEGLLRSGNTGRIVLKTNRQDVIKIPVLATYEMQDKILAGLLDSENRVERVVLKNYQKSGDHYIVTEGFKEGDRIIGRELGSIAEKAVVVPK